MKITIIQDIAVSPNAAKGDAAVVCAYPFSCRAPGGRIVCVYRQGTAKHSRDGVLMAQGSDDGGLSWGAPGLVYDGLGAAAPPKRAGASGAACRRSPSARPNSSAWAKTRR